MPDANRRPLGILELADPYDADPAPPSLGFDEAQWFGYPTVTKIVPNAWARDVVGGKPSLVDAYVETARELEKMGCAAITANCGYTIAFQEAVRDAVSIPVACSSLLQLPLVRNMLPKDGRIGLLCFDANTLSRDYLLRAGIVPEEVPMAIAGIQGTTSWKNWIAVNTTTEWNALERDVMGAARKLWQENPDITHWVLECTGFPRFRPLIKAMSGRPVFDWVTLCDYLMDST